MQRHDDITPRLQTERCGGCVQRHDDTAGRAQIERAFGSIEAFYAADARRRHSRERDVGLMWRGPADAAYRAAWVQETGEVYLVKHGHPVDGGGTVDLLARRFGLGELHAVLRGYAHVCGRAGSLAWFFDRIASGPVPAVAA
jgi:hypothetical protein